MRVWPAALTTGAVVMLGLMPAAAVAYGDSSGTDKSGSVDVIPSVLQPGETVEVDTDACGLDTFAVASSKAFESSISLEPIAEEFVLAGVGDIDKHAKPGKYKVKVDCSEGHQAIGHLRVVPRGSPDTGGGWLAGDQRPDPSGAPLGLVIGSAGLAGGLAVGAFTGVRARALRRRRDRA